MKKCLQFIFVLMLLVASAAATTVTGTIRDTGGSPIANGQLIFTLLGCSNSATQISDGTAVSGVYTIPLDANGAVNVVIAGNDNISCGGYNYWQVTAQGAVVISSGVSSRKTHWIRNYEITGSSFNIETVPALSGVPAPPVVATGTVVSVNGKTGIVALSSTDITGTIPGARMPIPSINVQDYPTIQAAVTAASGQKTVTVPAGTYTETTINIPAGGTLQADRNTVFSPGADITWNAPMVFVEKGVVYPFFPVGDVRRYGVFPDGVTNWETSFSGRMTAVKTNCVNLPNGVNWFPGLYETQMNMGSQYSGCKMFFPEGTEFAGLLHLISSANPLTFAITSTGLSRVSGVTTVTFASAHSYIVGQTVTLNDSDDNSFIGTFTVATVPDSTHITYAQPGLPDATSGSGEVDEAPLKNVRWTGTVVTYDRFGTINFTDSYVQRAIVKSDGTKHLAPDNGTKSRGAHIYHGTRRDIFGELIVEDGGGTNNIDACVAIDGNGDNPSDLSFGLLEVKACDTTAVYVTGARHTFNELVVNGYGAVGYTGTGMQDSNGLAQSLEMKGVWFNRTWDTHVHTLRVDNSATADPTKALYHVLVDETGLSSIAGSSNRGVVIDSLFARNCNNRCITFTDPTYPAPTMHAYVGTLEARLKTGATLPAGYALVNHFAESTTGRLTVDSLRLQDIAAQPGALFANGTVTRLGLLSSYNHGAARLLEAHGKLTANEIRGTYTGGSGTNPVVEISGAGVAGSIVAEINLQSPSPVSTPGVKLASASNVTIGKLTTAGYHSANGALWLDTLSQSQIGSFNLTSSSISGVGLHLGTSLTDVHLQNGYVNGFTTGISRDSGTVFTNTTALNIDVTGNTTATNVPAGSFATMNAPNLTLSGSSLDVQGPLYLGTAPSTAPLNTVLLARGTSGANPMPVSCQERITDEGCGFGFVRADGTQKRLIQAVPSGTSGVFHVQLGENTAMYDFAVMPKGWVRSLATVTFIAAPHFDAKLGALQTITLTGNVTASAFDSGIDGASMELHICEDATGGWTWLWPPTSKGGMTLNTAASKCNVQTFTYRGGTWYATGPGVSY